MPNRVELISDATTKQFSPKLNGVEVERIKAFALKGDANHGLTEMSLTIDVDTLHVN